MGVVDPVVFELELDVVVGFESAVDVAVDVVLVGPEPPSAVFDRGSAMWPVQAELRDATKSDESKKWVRKMRPPVTFLTAIMVPQEKDNKSSAIERFREIRNGCVGT